jgi:hypothetical protein
MRYVDTVHTLDRSIIMGGVPADPQGRDYALGCYFLTADGRDLILDNNVTPDRPQPVYGVRLGPALGPRYRWQGFWRRDFVRGSVVVNEPDGPARPLAGLSGRQWNGAPLPASLPPKAAVITLADR